MGKVNSPLASLLRQAWLQSQLSKAFPNAVQLQGISLPDQDGQKLARIASVLLEEDDTPQTLSQQELESCDKILQELQELVCSDTLLGFESAGESVFSNSDHLLSYAHTSGFTNINEIFFSNGSPSGRAFEHVVHKLRLPNPELIEMLLHSAWLVSKGHLTEAMPVIQTLIQQTSPAGNATQRLVYAFMEGLVARIYGSAPDPVKCIHLSLQEKLSFLKVSAEVFPFCRLPFLFANQAILKACEGFNKIHVVDYGGSHGYGFQWPSLIRGIGNRPGGPFEMRLTLIDCPSHGDAMKRMEEIRTRLTRYAVSKGVNLKVHAIEDRYDHIQAGDLNLRVGEVLIVNSLRNNHNLVEETLIPESPRKHWIKQVASMKPKLFTIAIENIAATAPVFMNRLVEILLYYATMYDMFETCMGDRAERDMLEQFIFGRQIVNVVGFEGLERTERAETYRCWHNRLAGEGFQVLPPGVSTLKRFEGILSSYQKPFYSGTDQGWLLLGWKGHITHALSAWNICKM